MTDYSDIDKSSQCIGRHSFRYAVMPHSGDWAKANLWNQSERFNLGMLVAQIAPTSHGTEPLEKSFLELEKEQLHVSAIKKSEDGNGWIVRLFNPFDSVITNKLRLNGGLANPDKTMSPVEAIQNEYSLPVSTRKWMKVKEVTLEEVPVKDLKISSDGWVGFEIKPKQILTIEFLP